MRRGRGKTAMVPIVCIAGKPESGKTGMIERLLPVLKERGWSVGVIKHTYHEVDLDTPGKDTARFTAAGSRATALVTAQGMALYRPEAADMDLETVAEEFFTGFDLVIAEGYKKEEQPKIEVLADGTEPNPDIEKRVAFISNQTVDMELPVFKHDDTEGVAGFIEENFLEKGSRSEVKVWVDGKFIPLKPFVKAFVGQTVKGMVNALKGAKGAEKIRLKIGR